MRILLSFALLALVGCGPKPFGLPVQFVVPDGYRGVGFITVDATNGTPVAAANEQFVVFIPTSGKASVQSLDFFSGRHVTSARYTSGEALPESHAETNIAFRIASYTPSTKTIVFVVGKETEARKAFTKY